MSGFTLAAGESALDPERTVYLISGKSSVLDSVLNQTREPNAGVLIKDSGVLGEADRLSAVSPSHARFTGRLRLLYVSLPPRTRRLLHQPHRSRLRPFRKPGGAGGYLSTARSVNAQQRVFTIHSFIHGHGSGVHCLKSRMLLLSYY